MVRHFLANRTSQLDGWKGVGGVYILWQGDEPFYIGQTQGMGKRKNVRDWGARGRSVSLFPIADKRQRQRAEMLLINKYEPGKNLRTYDWWVGRYNGNHQ